MCSRPDTGLRLIRTMAPITRDRLETKLPFPARSIPSKSTPEGQDPPHSVTGTESCLELAPLLECTSCPVPPSYLVLMAVFARFTFFGFALFFRFLRRPFPDRLALFHGFLGVCERQQRIEEVRKRLPFM